MIRLDDLVEANRLLVKFGGEDQMPRLAARAIERSLELESRVQRALEYASEAPPNSLHARNMARILDGSITLEDVTQEVGEPMESRPMGAGEERQAITHQPGGFQPFEQAVRRRGPGKKSNVRDTYGRLIKVPTGLTGRSTEERLAIREWIAEQKFDVAPFGRIPERFIEMYDEAHGQAQE